MWLCNSHNGWLQEVSVYATDLRAAAAAREGMNAAGRFIFQAAMYGSMAASTVGISSAVGGALWRMGARQAAKGGLANSRALGIAGEQAVGVGAKTRIPSLTGTAKYRIPDQLTSTTLGEVKNVSHLSLTRQQVS